MLQELIAYVHPFSEVLYSSDTLMLSLNYESCPQGAQSLGPHSWDSESTSRSMSEKASPVILTSKHLAKPLDLG